MVSLRKAAVLVQKATSYDGASFSNKKLRMSPSNEPIDATALQFRNGDLNSKNKTDRHNCFEACCLGNKRRKRRRLQFTDATGSGYRRRHESNGTDGGAVTYQGVHPSIRQFTTTNQGYYIS